MTRAFTIVELLAAVAIAAVIAVGLVRVAGSVGPRPVPVVIPEDAVLAAEQLLRADLLHSRAMRRGPGEVSLAGPNAIDPRSLRPTHRLAAVTYRLATVNGRSWLVRDQKSFDPLDARTDFAELVCAGALAIEVTEAGAPPAHAEPARTPLRRPSPGPSATGAARPAAPKGEWAPLGPGCAVRLVFAPPPEETDP